MPLSGLANEAKRHFAVQFHPEVELTVNGRAMFRNFLYNVCGCQGTAPIATWFALAHSPCMRLGLFTVKDREVVAIEEIRAAVGDKKALVRSNWLPACLLACLPACLHSALVRLMYPFQVLVSGGVDSSVCAALVSKALGPDRVIALHIDNGFMRLDESAKGRLG